MRKFFVKTFWCQMNQADSEKINMLMMQSWYMRAKEMLDADVVIMNTCSVRQKWEDRVFWFIREIHKENKRLEKSWSPKKILAWITWCMVRKTWLNKKYLEDWATRKKVNKIDLLSDHNGIFNFDDSLFVRNDNIDFVFRIEEVSYLTKILSYIKNEHIWSDDKFDDYLKAWQARENPSSANVIIQTWCDNFCSYCIVPFTRWKEISRNKDEILEEIKNASDSWAKEVTLLWQNVNSYWKQFNLKHWNKEKSKWNEWIWKSPFRDLLEWINEIDWIDRIRFTSSNPHDMTPDILDSHFELDKTCNYLHFALQSWSNDMLKRMNRRHTYEDFKKMCEYLRNKDPLFSISTDIIVWYSWETEEMFQETVRALEEICFDFVFIARYSVRKWTLWEKMYPDDISPEEKARRWHELNNVLEKSVKKRNELMLWREEEIFITKIKDNYMTWRTRNFKEVAIPYDDSVKLWDLIKVKIKELDSWILKWERV